MRSVNPESSDGIVLLAKQAGRTSFSSLWQIKNALGTKKIGHTGTLDSFADGLLVALSGRYTRLCSWITDTDKTYTAKIIFGKETDTLDPEGLVIAESSFPSFTLFSSIIKSFTGTIQQIPPFFSALHVDGQRASDRVRRGEEVVLASRPVTIFDLSVIQAYNPQGNIASKDDLLSSVIIDVRCSKGTYIRSLARDIAIACGSRGHLGALRRTRVGPFALEDAAGYSLLPSFGSPTCSFSDKEREIPRADPKEIISCSLLLTPEISRLIHLDPVQLHSKNQHLFLSGMPLFEQWFSDPITGIHSVFIDDKLMGIVERKEGKVSYGFVAGVPN